MEITTELIKDLRDKSGVSVMQCKKALEEAGGDMQKAISILQKKSKEIAAKKQDRTLGAGVVASYIHATRKVGSMVELLCETDFVSGNADFQNLARDIAMHVSATNPDYLKMDDVSPAEMEKSQELFASDVEGKPEDIKKKIIEGKLASYWGERVLLDQPFIKNPDLTIRDLINSAIQKFGEKIEMSRFTRFSI
jgi:elongation factor Ts